MILPSLLVTLGKYPDNFRRNKKVDFPACWMNSRRVVDDGFATSDVL